MKIGDLVQSRWEEERELFGMGMIVDRCKAGQCDSQIHKHAHWVIHFPNRKARAGIAAFIHAGPRVWGEGEFKWRVI